MQLRILFLWLAVAAAACQGFRPPTAATRQRLRAMELAPVPPRFVVEIESPALTGVFDAVFAVGAQGFSLQLFPDIGGKVLDLAVAGDRIVAATPAGPYLAVAPLDEAPPHLALVLAAVFAELLAPVDGARVLGERDAADGAEVLLAPALGSGEVVAVLGADGAVAAYRITLGWLAFTLHGDGRLEGRSLHGQLRWPDGG